MVHTPVVKDVSVTVSPDEADTVGVKVVLKAFVPGLGKLMVCGVGTTFNVNVYSATLFARLSLTLNFKLVSLVPPVEFITIRSSPELIEATEI